jgi:hypothetical protein
MGVFIARVFGRFFFRTLVGVIPLPAQFSEITKHYILTFYFDPAKFYIPCYYNFYTISQNTIMIILVSFIGRRLGAGGASTAARSGAKLANLHKLLGKILPPLAPNRLLCDRPIVFRSL